MTIRYPVAPPTLADVAERNRRDRRRIDHEPLEDVQVHPGVLGERELDRIRVRAHRDHPSGVVGGDRVERPHDP